MLTFPVGFWKATQTAVDPYAANVVLFLRGNGTVGSTSIIDSSLSPKTISVFGNTQIESDVSAINGTAIRFDGDGDYFTVPSSSDLNFPLDQPFTIEAWVKFYALPSSRQFLFGRYSPGDDRSILVDCISGNIRILTWNNILVQVAHGFVTDTRYHVAIAREVSGGTNTLRLFINGILIGSYTGAFQDFQNINEWEFGGLTYLGLGFWINANMQLIRMTNVCRYTTNFDPETDTYLNV
jgi:hypothetical protein